MTADSNPPLYFDCHLCGDCCSSWNIPIEAEKAKTLLTREWVQARLQEARRTLEPVSHDMYRLPLTDENVCIFLGEDRRCLVEVHEGSQLKPIECKKFPFASVKLSNGVTMHDTSAACKHISEKLLLAFQPILPKPVPDQASLADLQQVEATLYDDIEVLPARVFAGLFRKVEWTSQESTWQAQLHAIFSAPETSCEQAFWLTAQLIKTWPQLDPLKTPLENPQAVRIFLRAWLTIAFLRKPYGNWSWFSLLRGKRYDDSRVFGLPIDLRLLQKVTWDPVFDQHVKAFLFSILTRKRLLARGASLASLLAMAMIACLLVQWYSRVLASIRLEAFDQDTDFVQNEPTFKPSSQDVSTAIRLVERYYTGHQPRFLQFFCQRWTAVLLTMLLH